MRVLVGSGTFLGRGGRRSRQGYRHQDKLHVSSLKRERREYAQVLLS